MRAMRIASRDALRGTDDEECGVKEQNVMNNDNIECASAASMDARRSIVRAMQRAHAPGRLEALIPAIALA